MRKMYSKKELEKIIKGYLEAGEDIDLYVKTLKQSQANYSADIETFPNITNGTSAVIFCRVQQLNQELHIVFIGTITNNTESAISSYGTTTVNIELPSEIANRIYDLTGHTVHDTVADDYGISGNFAFVSKSNKLSLSTANNNARFIVQNTPIANRMSVSFGSGTAFSLNAGDVMYFEGRVSLDLL